MATKMANSNAACQALRQINAVARSSPRSSRAAGSGGAAWRVMSDFRPKERAKLRGSSKPQRPSANCDGSWLTHPCRRSSEVPSEGLPATPSSAANMRIYSELELEHRSKRTSAWTMSIAGVPIDSFARFVLNENRRLWILRPKLCPEYIHCVARGRDRGIVARRRHSTRVAHLLIRIGQYEEIAWHHPRILCCVPKRKEPRQNWGSVVAQVSHARWASHGGRMHPTQIWTIGPAIRNRRYCIAA